MTESSPSFEHRVYNRHGRHRGAVLIVGTGLVGGLLAEELARLGISPIWLLDRDVLSVENLARTTLGYPELDQPKAPALAIRIRRDFPLCDATGICADFLGLPAHEQLRLVRSADIVIAATDSIACQRRLNEVSLDAEVPAVYPGVWAGSGVRDAEVGEILWVLPGGHTPCYLCATRWRPEGADAEARGGTRADILPLVSATARVVVGLLDPRGESGQILDPERTLILVHGFMPTSAAVAAPGFFNGNLRYVRVPFPDQRCTVCGGQQRPSTSSDMYADHGGRTSAHFRGRGRLSSPTGSTRVAVGLLVLLLALVHYRQENSATPVVTPHTSASQYIPNQPSSEPSTPTAPAVRAEPESSQPSVAPSSEPSISSFDISGTWVGSHTCNQGLIGLRLTIIAQQGNSLTAKFDFYSSPTSNSGVPDGSFTMQGTYSSTGILLTHEQWLVQPAWGEMVDLSAGPPTDDGKLLAGVVTGVADCTDFSVQRSYW